MALRAHLAKVVKHAEKEWDRAMASGGPLPAETFYHYVVDRLVEEVVEVMKARPDAPVKGAE